MKLATPEQMKSIDSYAINNIGIPGLLLMENAALSVVSEAESMLGGLKGKRITVVAGKGNNGGDAFAAARLLYCRLADVRVYLAGSKCGITGDALSNMTFLENLGIEVNEYVEKLSNGINKNRSNSTEVDPNDLSLSLAESDLIIDGIFGTGLGREITGLPKRIIEEINLCGKPVLSIDIPSGVDGSDGSVKGVCIKADTTVTFCLPKTGLILHPGCEYTGKLIVANIGIPPDAVNHTEILTELIDDGKVCYMIPQRTQNSNKGDYGRVLVLTGSSGMTGSGCLASMAALASGAGLVFAGVPKSLANIYAAKLTEPIILPLADDGSGCLAVESGVQIISHMKRMNVAAIGPGLSTSGSIKPLVEKIIEESTVPLVIDADALNAISGNVYILKKLKTCAVITPHPGEMARLMQLEASGVQADRTGIAARFAKEYGVIVVLKGSRTVVAKPDGHVYVNTTGNPGMATAGTGDVLTGLIAGLIAQGAPADEASVAGVFLHGLAGDIAAKKSGMHGIVAGNVLKCLPKAFKEVLQKKRQNLHSVGRRKGRIFTRPEE